MKSLELGLLNGSKRMPYSYGSRDVLCKSLSTRALDKHGICYNWRHMDRGAWGYSQWGHKESDTTEHTHQQSLQQGSELDIWTQLSVLTSLI